MLNEHDERRLHQRAPSPLREATIQDPPLTDDGWLRVELDAEPGVIHECPWPYNPDGPVPIGDDAASVVESDGGNYWVVAWWPNNGPAAPSGGGGGGSGGHTIREDGTALAQRTSLNFAAGLTATDNAGADRTDVVAEVTQVELDAEATARADADATEAATRGNADATEAAARVAADNLRQLLSEKNQPNGYAGLDAAGKLQAAALPALAITSISVVASQAAQLALVAQEGDVAVRSDLNQSYVRNAGTAGTMADWTLLATPGNLVLSVAGKTGAVTLVKADVGLGNVDNTSDANKPVSTAQQAALDAKMPLANPTIASPTLLQARQVSAATALAAGGEIAYDPITGLLRWRDSVRGVDRDLGRLYGDTVPHVRMSSTGGYNVVAGSGANPTYMQWTAAMELADTDNMHGAANPSRITIQTPGVYQFTAMVRPQVGPPLFSANIIVNRTTYIGRANSGTNNPNWEATVTSEPVRLVAGDYVELHVVNSSTSGFSADADFAAIWLGGPGPTVSEFGVPSAKLYNSAQRGPTGTINPFPFDSVEHDTDGMASTANATITIKTPGIYEVVAHLEVSVVMAADSGNPYITLQKNGVSIDDGMIPRGQSGASLVQQVKCAAGDVLRLAFSASTTYTIPAGVRNSHFSATMLTTGKTVIPRARICRNAALSHTSNGNWQKIAFDAVDGGQDNDGMFDAANGRLVCKTAGTYLLTAQTFTSAATGERQAAIVVNGVPRGEAGLLNVPTGGQRCNPSCTWDLAVGDTVEVHVYQSSGGNLPYVLTDSVGAGGAVPSVWLSAVKVGLSGSGGDNRSGFSDDGAGQIKADAAVRFPNGVVQEAVTAFPLNTANWANQGAPYQTTRYYKTPEGEVVLEGLAKVTAAMAVGGASARIGTLPAGYAPTATRLFVVYGSQGSNSAQAFVRVAIKSDGTVTVEGAGPAWDGSVNSVVSFEGIRFRP